jgi:hypothetical protein
MSNRYPCPGFYALTSKRRDEIIALADRFGGFDVILVDFPWQFKTHSKQVYVPAGRRRTTAATEGGGCRPVCTRRALPFDRSPPEFPGRGRPSDSGQGVLRRQTTLLLLALWKLLRRVSYLRGPQMTTEPQFHWHNICKNYGSGARGGPLPSLTVPAFALGRWMVLPENPGLPRAPERRLFVFSAAVCPT